MVRQNCHSQHRIVMVKQNCDGRNRMVMVKWNCNCQNRIVMVKQNHHGQTEILWLNRFIMQVKRSIILMDRKSFTRSALQIQSMVTGCAFLWTLTCNLRYLVRVVRYYSTVRFLAALYWALWFIMEIVDIDSFWQYFQCVSTSSTPLQHWWFEPGWTACYQCRWLLFCCTSHSW